MHMEHNEPHKKDGYDHLALQVSSSYHWTSVLLLAPSKEVPGGQ